MEPLQVASVSGPAGVAVEPLQQAEQHRLAMVPASWRGHQQSRLTMASAARLGHHLAVKQAEQHRLAMVPASWWRHQQSRLTMVPGRWRGAELATRSCCVLPLRGSRLRSTAAAGRTGGSGANTWLRVPSQIDLYNQYRKATNFPY